MKVKVFTGKWDSWGFEISYCHYIKGLTIGFIHWYLTIEVWTKSEMESAAKHEQELREILAAWDKEAEKEEKKAQKKPAKKKATKKKSE